MRIPQRLAYLLERDQALDGAVKVSVSQFEPWIQHSNLPFFPEYTKHDIDHIEGVLRTAAGLISDEAWEALTPGDAAVLILAVLLHDCAMHISEDGFFSLLSDGRSNAPTLVPDKPWSITWEDFLAEARRFDGRELTRLFGDANPVRRPPMNVTDLTMRDRLLIGEFLRRHHPRLAQEIALTGVPTKGTPVLVLEGFSHGHDYIVRLAAIVARSHGDDVRTFLPFLREHFDIRQYKGVHAVFLMTLLRVADYLQITADRAPAQVLQVKQLSSPVSRGEWKAHHAIKDVRHTHEDPEALFVDALPEDVETFFRVQKWLRGIQSELDASWAVLGEVFGRYPGLNRLGLLLRRVRSTIDDVDAFSAKVAFVPVAASFRTAGPDLLKLLIEPLYGNRPEVGIRELMQNAVDAVRELHEYVKDRPEAKISAAQSHEDDVNVSIDTDADGTDWITVADRGIGMRERTIIEYFLNAGASFRRSDEWRRAFESADGKSKVLRAGRFGVGALASFLIGSEIHVYTRHVDEAMGVQFVATVESDLIALRKWDGPVGTTIRIRAAKGVLNRLMLGEEWQFASKGEHYIWDWYCLATPTVLRSVFGKRLKQGYIVPDNLDTISPKWHRVAHTDYAGVFWTYSAPAPNLVTNGIVVISERPYSLQGWKANFGLDLPKISVSDPNGRLPLNLERNGLTEVVYPFADELTADVSRDFVAFVLENGPTALDDTDFKLYEGRTVDGQRESDIEGEYFFSPSGFGLLDPWLLHRTGCKSIVECRWPVDDVVKFVYGPTIRGEPLNLLGEMDWWLRQTIDTILHEPLEESPQYPNYEHISIFDFLKFFGARMIVSQQLYARFTKRLPRGMRRAVSLEWSRHGFHLLSIGDCPSAIFCFEEFVDKARKSTSQGAVTEFYVDRSLEPTGLPIAVKWLEILESAEVPYDPDQRRNKFGRQFQDLRAYLRLIKPQ